MLMSADVILWEEKEHLELALNSFALVIYIYLFTFLLYTFKLFTFLISSYFVNIKLCF